MVNKTTKPINQSMGVVKRMRPRYIVKSKLKILTPVGMAMTIVMMPKKALTAAPAPIVKKWCSHTTNESMTMAQMEKTIEVYPANFFPEKTGTISEKIPNAGKIRI